MIAYLEIPDPATPYQEWADQFPSHDLTDPDGDVDGDGVGNFHEFAFGLDPTNGNSSNPIVNGIDPATHSFRYTRLGSSGLGYTVWTSDDLVDWTEQTDIDEQVGRADANGVVTVDVTLNSPPVSEALFIRVKAD